MITIQQITDYLINFITIHNGWIAPIVFLLAFAESLVIISLLVPATVILLAMSIFIGKSNTPFHGIFIAAAAGAFLGDWISYYIGFHFKKKIAHIWPFKKKPEMLEKGYEFFHSWGIIGVFVGRFFGPLRAIIPLIAGVCEMNHYQFFIANILSAIIWAFGILAPGLLGIPWLIEFIH